MATKTSKSENNPDNFVKLMVDSYETSLKGYITCAKIPLVMYKSFSETWLKAVEDVLNDVRPKP